MIIGRLCFSGCSGEIEDPVPEPKVEEKVAIGLLCEVLFVMII